MYIQPDLKNKVNEFLNISEGHMGDALGITFTSFKPDEIKATMPVNENSIQPFGYLHGGASVALAETLASVGAWLTIDDDKTAMGIEINANHVRAVKKGVSVSGVAKPVRKGRRIHVWETKIFNEDEKLVCISRCTLAVVNSSRS